VESTNAWVGGKTMFSEAQCWSGGGGDVNDFGLHGGEGGSSFVGVLGILHGVCVREDRRVFGATGDTVGLAS